MKGALRRAVCFGHAVGVVGGRGPVAVDDERAVLAGATLLPLLLDEEAPRAGAASLFCFLLAAAEVAVDFARAAGSVFGFFARAFGFAAA